MILTCPSCSTRYRVDPDKFLPDGRQVRCANCAHSWYEPAPQEDAPVAEAVAEEIEAPVEEAARREIPSLPPPPAFEEAPARTQFATEDKSAIRAMAEARRMERRLRPSGRRAYSHRSFNILGWACFVFLLAGGAVAAHAYRADIVKFWPQAGSLYGGMGQDVNVDGFEIRGASARRVQDNGMAVLEISGEVVNVGEFAAVPPRLKVVLLDGANKELRSWSAVAAESSIGPRSRRSFRTQLVSPPAEARDVRIVFAGARE